MRALIDPLTRSHRKAEENNHTFNIEYGSCRGGRITNANLKLDHAQASTGPNGIMRFLALYTL